MLQYSIANILDFIKEDSANLEFEKDETTKDSKSKNYLQMDKIIKKADEDILNLIIESILDIEKIDDVVMYLDKSLFE